MSIETTFAKFGKLLDKAYSNTKNIVRLLFSTSDSRRKRNGYHNQQSTRGYSPYLILIFDSFVAFLSLFISIHLRIGMDFLDYSPMYILKNMFVFGLVSASVFSWIQTYQTFWRYTSVEDMVPIFISVILANALFFPLMMLMNQEDFLPYSILVINAFVLSFMLMVPRFLSRILYNQKIKKQKKFDAIIKRSETSSEIPDVLLIGNIDSAEAFFREVVSNEDVTFNFNPVGILLIDQMEIGRVIKGIPILGELRDISVIMRNLHKEGKFPRQIVITEKILSDNAKRFLIKFSQEHGILLMHAMFQCTFNTVSQ